MRRCYFFLFLYITTCVMPQVVDAKKSRFSLDKKQVMFIGNSFIYYGGCVINGLQKQLDYGFFNSLCESQGECTQVYDCTYGGHHLKDFTHQGCSSPKLHVKGPASGCEGVGTQLLDSSQLADIDIVFISEAGENNKDIVADVKAIMDRFPNPKTRFFYLVHTYTYYKKHQNILTNLSQLQTLNVHIVPWGQVAYDLTQGNVVLPHSSFTYTPQTFIKNKGDKHHPNPLAGYITTLMAYCAATGVKAQGMPYDFVSRLFPASAFVAKHYQSPSDTNYPDIIASPKEMKKLQKLIDKYLKQ